VPVGWTIGRPGFRSLASRRGRFEPDMFGQAAVMFIGPCMADEAKVRLIVHIGGNLTEVLPYLNAAMPQACFNPGSPSLTFMEEQRLITLYPRKVISARQRSWSMMAGDRVPPDARELRLGQTRLDLSVVQGKIETAGTRTLQIAAANQLQGLRRCDVHGIRGASVEWNRGAFEMPTPVFARVFGLRGPLVELCGSYGVFEYGGPG